MVALRNRSAVTPRHVAVILFVCLAVAACAPRKSGSSKWATAMDPPPAGLTLQPKPPDHVYWFAIARASLNARTSGGKLWDDMGGWPDPLAILFVDGKEVMRTATASDTLKPVWEARGNITIDPSSVVELKVFDDDTIKNSPMGGATLSAPSTSDLTAGQMVLQVGHAGSVNLRVSEAHGLLGLGFDYKVVSGRALVSDVIEHSSAGRAGLRIGDQIMSIGERSFQEMNARAIRSAINSLGTTETPVVVRRKEGAARNLSLRVEALYPLYAEVGQID